MNDTWSLQLASFAHFANMAPKSMASVMGVMESQMGMMDRTPPGGLCFAEREPLTDEHYPQDVTPDLTPKKVAQDAFGWWNLWTRNRALRIEIVSMEPDTLPTGLTAIVNCAPAHLRAKFRLKMSYAMLKLMLSKRPARIAANMKRAHAAKTDGLSVCEGSVFLKLGERAQDKKLNYLMFTKDFAAACRVFAEGWAQAEGSYSQNKKQAVIMQ